MKADSLTQSEDTSLLEKDSISQQWWKNSAVYQIYPRSFADSNGDGIGDLQGIISRLPHLETLGIDVIWLSPIYSSPQDDNGYDISDYQSIDPIFGTLDDFDELITQIHKSRMKLVMDLVVNHTSDEHPWFVESASSLVNSKRDWYWWRKPCQGHTGGEPGAEPNNWGSFFSGPAWKFDEATGEYFLHLFSSKQPDLNWENSEVRQAVYSMMRWWLDRGVDGFRMDVINLISKDPSLPNGDLPPGASFGNGFPHYSYGPRIHEFLAEMHEEVFAGREAQLITVGEMPGVSVDQAQLFTDATRHELNMVFQFEHMGLDHGAGGKWDHKPLDLRELKSSFHRWQTGLADTGWNSLYWNNHDQPRAVSRFGNDEKYWSQSAKALAAVLHLQKGTPFIYQGEEIGMTNVPFSDIDDFRDIESLNYFMEATDRLGVAKHEVLQNLRRASRDNARTPMQWSPGPNAGFTFGNPWIGVNPNFSIINADSQVGNRESIFEFYRSLINLRKTETILVNGDFTMLEADHQSLFSYLRTWRNESLLVIANLSNEPLNTIETESHFRASEMELILSNYEQSKHEDVNILLPWEVKIFKG
jgi:oligo-1,6-glucosidase